MTCFHLFSPSLGVIQQHTTTAEVHLNQVTGPNPPEAWDSASLALSAAARGVLSLKKPLKAFACEARTAVGAPRVDGEEVSR